MEAERRRVKAAEMEERAKLKEPLGLGGLVDYFAGYFGTMEKNMETTKICKVI